MSRVKQPIVLQDVIGNRVSLRDAEFAPGTISDAIAVFTSDDFFAARANPNAPHDYANSHAALRS